MILCMNCGRQDYYIKVTAIKQVEKYSESGQCFDMSPHVVGSENIPRCPNCHREVKFFKDGDDNANK